MVVTQTVHYFEYGMFFLLTSQHMCDQNINRGLCLPNRKLESALHEAKWRGGRRKWRGASIPGPGPGPRHFLRPERLLGVPIYLFGHAHGQVELEAKKIAQVRALGSQGPRHSCLKRHLAMAWPGHGQISKWGRPVNAGGEGSGADLDRGPQ